jgi:hypothetical protein
MEVTRRGIISNMFRLEEEMIMCMKDRLKEKDIND